MKRIWIGILLSSFLTAGWGAARLMSISAFPAGPADSAAGVRVTFVGNAGFLIEIGGKKILIDAIFKGFENEYLLPQHVQDALVKARPPFNDVDLILVTHNHGDHFDAAMVRQHLKNNPGARLASTDQVTSQLAEFGDRVLPLAAAAGKPVQADVAGIAVKAIYMSHGRVPEGREETINNAYLVTVAQTTFFHTGDIDASLIDTTQPLSPGKRIDLAFLSHFYFDGNPLARKFIKEWVDGRFIIPIHYHFTTPVYSRERVLKFYPDAILFDKELQNWTMPLVKIP
jgi:L-ascorbate metabolism protein UlaG (beta-lactamase superfamily)